MGVGEGKENLMLPLLFADCVSPCKASSFSECKRSSGVWGPRSPPEQEGGGDRT